MEKVKGWTLIELVLVIIIMTITGYVGIAYFAFIPQWQDAQFAEKFLSLCRLGHNIALATECEVVLDDDKQGVLHLYQKAQCQGPLIPMQGYALALPKGLTYRQTLPLYFQKEGTIFNARHEQQAEYQLQTKSKRLNLSGITGMMHLHEKH